MSEVVWSEFDPSKGKVMGIAQQAYIEVIVYLTLGEFEVCVWGGNQSSGAAPSHSVIGQGGIERGKQEAERLLQEGLERF